MPQYDLKCTGCAHSFSDVHPMSQPHPACPSCGKPCEVDFARQGAPKMPAHDLHGTRSLSREFRFGPKTVKEARELYGGDAAKCIGDDGRVRFTHRDEGKKFITRDQQLRQAAEAKRAARKAQKAKEAAERPSTPATQNH